MLSLTRVGVATCQRLFHRGIVFIYIPEKTHLAVRLDHGCSVEDEYGNGFVEIYLNRLIAVHRSIYFVRGPFRLIAQNPRRQPRGVLYTDASMAEVAPRFQKQFGRRGAMEVHVITVREYKLDQSQCVFGSGLLSYTQ